jgi:hypothetical protein
MWQAAYLLRGLMNKAIVTLLGAGMVVMAGCNGWPTTLPYAQAETKPEKYQTYAPAAAEAVPMFYAGNHRFMVMPGHTNLRGARTSSVAATGSPVSAFALEGDEPPYGNLFARNADGSVSAVAAID